jgi:hypothetical protein
MLPFHISGSGAPRPATRATIWCDGEAGPEFRDGADLELSHWAPNRTPARYRADTSTEIVLRWAADPARRRDFDLVVNGHVDVDGVLSVWAAADPGAALAHADVLVGAAEIGDFAAWGDLRAFVLYQGLALLQAHLADEGADGQTVYARCIERLPALLAPGAASEPAIAAGIEALASSAALVDRGDVAVEVVHPRLAHFLVPRDLAGRDVARALRQPAFNAPLDDTCLLLPHVRARDHEERFQLVSTAVGDRWHHDLCVPGYAWADVEERWIPPGLPRAPRKTDEYDFPPIVAALADLQRDERGGGVWTLATEVTPFATVPGREFPVLASPCARDGGPAPSTIPPADVAARIAAAIG